MYDHIAISLLFLAINISFNLDGEPELNIEQIYGEKPLLVEGNNHVEEEVVMASMPIMVEEKVEKENGGKVMEGVPPYSLVVSSQIPPQQDQNAVKTLNTEIDQAAESQLTGGGKFLISHLG